MRRTQLNGDVSSVQHHRNGEFRRLLAKSGISQSGLGKMIGAHVNTVSRWNAGKTSAPGSVLAFLRFYADVKLLLDRD